MSVASLPQRNLRTGLVAFAVALGMLGLGFAAVPLYRLFCQATGLNGTTQRASETQAVSAEEMARSAGAPVISIRFDATIGAWRRRSGIARPGSGHPYSRLAGPLSRRRRA